MRIPNPFRGRKAATPALATPAEVPATADGVAAAPLYPAGLADLFAKDIAAASVPAVPSTLPATLPGAAGASEAAVPDDAGPGAGEETAGTDADPTGPVPADPVPADTPPVLVPAAADPAPQRRLRLPSLRRKVAAPAPPTEAAGSPDLPVAYLPPPVRRPGALGFLRKAAPATEGPVADARAPEPAEAAPHAEAAPEVDAAPASRSRLPAFLRKAPSGPSLPVPVQPAEASEPSEDDAPEPRGGIRSLLRRKPKELSVEEVVAEQVEAGEIELAPDVVVPVSKERHSFAEYLLSKGMVDPIQINAALLEQRVNKELLGHILVRNGFMSPKDLIDAVLAHNAERIATEKVQTCRIPVERLERINTIINGETEDAVYVGTLGDEDDIRAIVEQFYPDKKIVFVAFLPDLLPDFIERMRRTSAGLDDSDVRQDEMMERLLYRALKEGASDVHIEPKLDSYAVFFRRLGERVLSHMGTLEEYNTIVSQLKDRSRMDLAERRVGQDGGFQIEYSGKYVDLRVATVPAVEGEQVIIRVLDPDRVRPKLEQLGISGVKHWRRGITRKNGLCLICGETGSGKTTTLNASVRELDRFGKKIYTAEDPVEYRIPYVGQVSMNSGVGYGFAQAIRNFMRADPDVMILGEVRDPDTARNAVKAAETGHLVIATLHTGNIISSLSRLRDLEIPPFELRFILRSVLVQTLVKVVCRSCEGHGHSRGAVCPVCAGSGYSDRTIVSECHSFGSHTEVDEIIAMTQQGHESKGDWPWKKMIDDGIDKMLEGVTTSEEMKRNFGSEFDDRMVAMNLDPNDYLLAKNRAGASREFEPA